MCHETVVLLNQIMAADVKTQHTDVPQFLVLTGFSQWWHWKSIYWTQINYTWVQFTAFLSHLSQNTKKTKTNKQKKTPSMYKIIGATADWSWLSYWHPGCLHASAAAALHFLIVLRRNLTALRHRDEVLQPVLGTILAAAPHPVLARQYLSTQDRSLWIRSISWHIPSLLISNMPPAEHTIFSRQAQPVTIHWLYSTSMEEQFFNTCTINAQMHNSMHHVHRSYLILDLLFELLL